MTGFVCRGAVRRARRPVVAARRRRPRRRPAGGRVRDLDGGPGFWAFAARLRRLGGRRARWSPARARRWSTTGWPPSAPADTLRAGQRLDDRRRTAGAGADRRSPPARCSPSAATRSSGWASVAVCLAAAALALRFPEAPRTTDDEDAGRHAAARVSPRRCAVRRCGVLVLAVALIGGLDAVEEYFPVLAGGVGRGRRRPSRRGAGDRAGRRGRCRPRAAGPGRLPRGRAARRCSCVAAGCLAAAALWARPAALVARRRLLRASTSAVLVVAEARLQDRIAGAAPGDDHLGRRAGHRTGRAAGVRRVGGGRRRSRSPSSCWPSSRWSRAGLPDPRAGLAWRGPLQVGRRGHADDGAEVAAEVRLVEPARARRPARPGRRPRRRRWPRRRPAAGSGRAPPSGSRPT